MTSGICSRIEGDKAKPASPCGCAGLVFSGLNCKRLDIQNAAGAEQVGADIATDFRVVVGQDESFALRYSLAVGNPASAVIIGVILDLSQSNPVKFIPIQVPAFGIHIAFAVSNGINILQQFEIAVLQQEGKLLRPPA